MTDSFSGGCACGAIRYRSSGPARYMGNCHCRGFVSRPPGVPISPRFWLSNPTSKSRRVSQAGLNALLIVDMPCAGASVRHAGRRCS